MPRLKLCTLKHNSSAVNNTQIDPIDNESMDSDVE